MDFLGLAWMIGYALLFFLTCCHDFGFRAMEATNAHPSRISEFGTLEQSLGFRVEDTINLSRSMLLMF